MIYSKLGTFTEAQKAQYVELISGRLAESLFQKNEILFSELKLELKKFYGSEISFEFNNPDNLAIIISNPKYKITYFWSKEEVLTEGV